MSYSHASEHFSNPVTASMETLFVNAPATAARYFKEAIAHIDQAFGKGYAKEHPELVAGFMQTCAKDFHTLVLTQAIQESVATLRDELHGVWEELARMEDSQ